MAGYGQAFGGLVMLLFAVFVIAGVVWLVLAMTRSQAFGTGGGSSALHILEERLARGEIDADEFRTRRAAILERTR